jgi:hypothetical protein
MSESVHGEPKDLDGLPDPKTVAKRADDRPPEEGSSEDPMAQAQSILEESEERIADGAKGSALPRE